ncbi:hypothetical protein B296_00021272 [Ensete ventricosum]|uniref:Uncharacterized protein n=1 Tax=Ensete ventricosum TaxID=4639 RepID=A0A426ZZ44_ENSVE|nr:hypothetical protein B296_00021272 [Ensete ventricosum]
MRETPKFDLHPVSFGITDSMPVLLLEELCLLAIISSRAKVVNREDFGQRGPLLEEEELVPADKEVEFLEIKYRCRGKSGLNDPCLQHLLDNPLSFDLMKMWISIWPNMGGWFLLQDQHTKVV